MTKLLTRKEAAARLGITTNTLDLERAAGHLAYIQRKPHGKVWIPEEAIEEYLARAHHPVRPDRKPAPNRSPAPAGKKRYVWGVY